MFWTSRNRSLIVSLASTLALNGAAGALTLLYRNGITIFEINRSSRDLLIDLGAGALLVRDLEIAAIYPVAYLVSIAIASSHPLLSSKRILTFAFFFMLFVLPIGAFVDLLNDLLVVFARSDILANAGKIVVISASCAVVLAALKTQTARSASRPANQPRV